MKRSSAEEDLVRVARMFQTAFRDRGLEADVELSDILLKSSSPEEAKQRLMVRIGEVLWLRPIELLSFDGATLRLRAPNSYIRLWFESNFLGTLLKEIQDLGHDVRVEFDADGPDERRPPLPAPGREDPPKEAAPVPLPVSIEVDHEAIAMRKRQRPPVHLLNAIVKGLWSAKTYARVFKPVIADIHHEWADARRRHEKFRAWWIRHVRGRYAVLAVARHQLPWSTWSAIKRLVQLMFTFSK